MVIMTRTPFPNLPPQGLQNYAKRQLREKSDCVSSSGKFVPCVASFPCRLFASFR
jgi:hypothetical protein